MRFHIGSPPLTPDFAPQDDGWTPLWEPSPFVLNLIATPVGIFAGILTALAWTGGELRITFPGYHPLVLLAVVVLGLPLMIAVHEFIHGFAYEKFGFTDTTVIAFWPAKMLFLAITFNAYSRNRMLLVYVLPLVVISFVPLLICRLAGIQSGVAMFFSVVNAMCAGGDIFCILLIAAQVPAKATLRNQGWTTWWKAVE